MVYRGRPAGPEGLGKKKQEDTLGNLRGGGCFSPSGERGWRPISSQKGQHRPLHRQLTAPPSHSSPRHLVAQHLPSPPAASSTSLTSSRPRSLTRTRSSTTCHSITFLRLLSQKLSSLPDTSQTPSSPTCDSRHLPGPPGCDSKHLSFPLGRNQRLPSTPVTANLSPHHL